MRLRATVHPRACGERGHGPHRTPANGGSSPRLRGTLQDALALGVADRFIPAPAGNATLLHIPGQQLAVHPRACGERGAVLIVEAEAVGSSPRLRGTRFRGVGSHAVSRFIPAPAGNARSIRPIVLPATVHPRACGERSWIRNMTSQRCGSSPRLRGTRACADPQAFGSRFIPAPAGNALGVPRTIGVRAVHPRACGERRNSGD